MKLTFIDLDNLIIRVQYANPTLEEKELIGKIFKSIKIYIEDHDPDVVMVCADSGKSEYRKNLYPEYKANRDKGELSEKDKIFLNRKRTVKGELMSSLTYLGAIVVSSYGIEADDIINRLCERFKTHNKVIISTDGDFYQLISPTTSINDPRKKINITYKTVLAEYNFLNLVDIKRYFVMKKCILGDTSDNIKGVPGYGKEKTPKLLEKMFSGSLSEKEKTTLKENMHVLDRNKKLINLSSLPDEYKFKIDAAFSAAVESTVKQGENHETIIGLLEDKLGIVFDDAIYNIRNKLEGVLDELG